MEAKVRIDTKAIGPQLGFAECMVEGCGRTVSGWVTMCRRHWSMVPKAVTGDGSPTSEGQLVDAFWRQRPAWVVGAGATEAHRYQVGLAVECVKILLEEGGHGV